MESNPIKTYEPCQVRKEAAISSLSLCGILSIEGLNNQDHFFLLNRKNIKDVIKWGTQLFIENLDH